MTMSFGGWLSLPVQEESVAIISLTGIRKYRMITYKLNEVRDVLRLLLYYTGEHYKEQLSTEEKYIVCMIKLCAV
jgi:hypothetical protein